VLAELSKLMNVPDLYKILDKSVSGLKWKMIEEVFERKNNDSRFGEEKGRILAFEIFRLMLFPKLTGIISLEAAATFVAFENTQINPNTTILA